MAVKPVVVGSGQEVTLTLQNIATSTISVYSTELCTGTPTTIEANDTGDVTFTLVTQNGDFHLCFGVEGESINFQQGAGFMVPGGVQDLHYEVHVPESSTGSTKKWRVTLFGTFDPAEQPTIRLASRSAGSDCTSSDNAADGTLAGVLTNEVCTPQAELDVANAITEADVVVCVSTSTGWTRPSSIANVRRHVPKYIRCGGDYTCQTTVSCPAGLASPGTTSDDTSSSSTPSGDGTPETSTASGDGLSATDTSSSSASRTQNQANGGATPGFEWSVPVIAGIAAGGAVLLAATIVGVVVCVRRRRRKRDAL